MISSAPTKPRRTFVTIEVTPEVAERFKARFSSRGERTLYLRRMIEQTVATGTKEPAPKTAVADRALPASRVALRLYPDQIASIEAEAAKTGMKPAQWMRAVLQARFDEQLTLPEADRVAVSEATDQVRRAGNNHNQLTKAAKRAVVNGKPLLQGEAAIAELSAALDSLKTALDGLLKSRRRYWGAKNGSRHG